MGWREGAPGGREWVTVRSTVEAVARIATMWKDLDELVRKFKSDDIDAFYQIKI